MYVRLMRVALLGITLAIAAGGAIDIEAAKRKQTPRDINKVRKEQTATTKAIKEANRKLNVNTKETKRQLDKLSTLTVEIEDKRKEISVLQGRTNTIASAIKSKQDSITILDGQLAKLRQGYIVTLQRMQEAPASMSAMTFLFASESFSEAWRRLRYMQQFGEWHKSKLEEIKEASQRLNVKKQELEEMHRQQSEMLGKVDKARKQLENTQEETNRIVAGLKKEQGALKAALKENEAKAKKLDQELDRLIAEEQKRQERQERERREKEKRELAQKKAAEQKQTANTGKNQGGKTTTKPSSSTTATKTTVSSAGSKMAEEDRKLTGSFESNKGRLLFPVSGRYKIIRGYGVQKHPELSHVETNNNGIDVEVSPATRVRSIYEGTVSAIFVQPGYNTIVMIRHGNYLSIYAGLQGVTVKKGDKVKTNQTIGSVSPDVDNDNRAILHFELRKEREKLNPMQWVK